MRRRCIYSRYFKRQFDFILSLLLFIILSPIIIILYLLVKLNLGSPIIFKQQRPGKNEKIFYLYKFRTMTNKTDENGSVLSDSFRLTRFGKFMRSTSLDELPSLLNIIKGDLSIVGPRPLLIQYLPLYNETQRRRHEVLPGLTGLAQVAGRNSLSWPDKFKLDIEYIDNISFRLDVKIILKTVIKVVTRSGISSTTSQTMEAFTGNEKS